MKPVSNRTADRRRFIQTSAVAAWGWSVGAAGLRGEATTATGFPDGSNGPVVGGAYREPAREVPIVSEADVVVCGGGPAGVAAATAAARAGAKTWLLEAHGCLGGIWTSGLLSYILDSRNKPGILQEIFAALQAREKDTRRVPSMYDPESMKLLLEQMCVEAGVQVQLHTQCAAALRDATNRLASIVTES